MAPPGEHQRGCIRAPCTCHLACSPAHVFPDGSRPAPTMQGQRHAYPHPLPLPAALTAFMHCTVKLWRRQGAGVTSKGRHTAQLQVFWRLLLSNSCITPSSTWSMHCRYLGSTPGVRPTEPGGSTPPATPAPPVSTTEPTTVAPVLPVTTSAPETSATPVLPATTSVPETSATPESSPLPASPSPGSPGPPASPPPSPGCCLRL